MRYKEHSKTFLFLSILIVLLFPGNAFAYLDAGTGSYILQLIIAVFLGVLTAVKIFWQRIKNFFSNLSSKKDKHKISGE